jgi:hypothetical protein
MPKFTLPARKKQKNKEKSEVPAMDDFRRHTTLPANDEILNKLDIGDKVTVTLEGKVTELSKHESDHYKERHFGVEITIVECYPTTKDKEEKDFARGYKKGSEK